MQILFLSCLILLASFTLISTESSKSDRSGRFIFPFNLLRNLKQRPITICPLGCDGRIQTNTITNTIQNSQLPTLTLSTAGLQKKCPPLAIGAKKIGSFCYTVHTIKKSFIDASHDCVKRGGYLAEPTTVNSAALYTDLTSNFPVDIATISAEGTAAERHCYIGIRRMVTNQLFYAYKNNGQIFPLNDPFIINVPADIAANLIALQIAPGGVNFRRETVGATPNTPPTAQRCSICQYKLH